MAGAGQLRGKTHESLLKTLVYGYFVTFVSVVVLSLFPALSLIYLLAVLLDVGLALLGVEFVYQDAKAINELVGTKAIDPVGWSLFVFLLAIIALPWYVFGRRKEALSPSPILPAEPSPVLRFCPNCGFVVASGVRFCSHCGKQLV
ncbi:MAG: zinc ribbon domain-containing protein [Thaumarchaeota archaeon]|nr:zinc ribbon domain-containing protein [Nitrososphaerota archaeon]